MTNLTGLRKLGSPRPARQFRLPALTPRRLLAQKVAKVGAKFNFLSKMGK